MSILWSPVAPPPSHCPQCRSERILFVFPASPEVELWRCLDCETQWEIGPGGQVVLPGGSPAR
jgi:hypothetical protein